MTKYTERSNKTKNMIKTINYKPGKYDEKRMKIKFNSDDQLPLNKTLKLYNLDIIYILDSC